MLFLPINVIPAQGVESITPEVRVAPIDCLCLRGNHSKSLFNYQQLLGSNLKLEMFQPGCLSLLPVLKVRRHRLLSHGRKSGQRSMAFRQQGQRGERLRKARASGRDSVKNRRSAGWSRRLVPETSTHNDFMRTYSIHEDQGGTGEVVERPQTGQCFHSAWSSVEHFWQRGTISVSSQRETGVPHAQASRVSIRLRLGRRTIV